MSKNLRITLTLCLVAVLLLGAVWAYLSGTTEQKVNTLTFLGAEGIDAVLEEPLWDGGTIDDPTAPVNPEDPDLGKNKAKKIIPGCVVPKNPLIINTGVIDEWVGMKLVFVDGEGALLTQAQMTELMRIININWNTAQWTQIDAAAAIERADTPVQYWLYKDCPLASDAAIYSAKSRTEALFTTVTFPDDMTPADYQWLSGKAPLGDEGDIPAPVSGFQILIKGAGIQADMLTVTTVVPEMHALLLPLLP